MSISSVAQAAKSANEIFKFIDPVGTHREIEILPGTFFCVCVGGFQVGDSLNSPVDAHEFMNRLAENRAHFTQITVETYRQVDDGDPMPAKPYFIRGCWTI